MMALSVLNVMQITGCIIQGQLETLNLVIFLFYLKKINIYLILNKKAILAINLVQLVIFRTTIHMYVIGVMIHVSLVQMEIDYHVQNVKLESFWM